MPALVLLSVGLAAALGLCAFLVLALIRSRATRDRAESRLEARIETFRNANLALDEKLASLERDRNWYRDLFANSNDLALAYTVTDEDLPGSFIDMNDVACRELEYSRERLLELTPLDIETFRIPDTTVGAGGVEMMSLANAEQLGRDSSFAASNMQMLVRRVLREGHADYEGGYVTQSGRLIPAEIRARRFDRDGRTAIVCVARDVTQRRKHEALVRENRQLMDLFLNRSAVGIVLFDGQRTIQQVNAQCLKMFGCPDSDELVKLNLFENEFIPDSASQAIRRGDSLRFEMVVDFDKAMTEGQYTTSRTGRGYFDVHFTNLGATADFAPRGYLVQVHDITRRRLAESALHQRERQLRQAQKMEAIGTLAGGIAHDFNNILTPILGYAELGLDLCREGEEMHDYMEEILSSSKRAKGLVNQILVFSRQVEGAGEPIHMASIVKEVAKQLAGSLPDGIEVQCHIRTTDDRVLANPTQIHQVLMNLCTNAGYVMREQGGSLEISLTAFMLSYRHRSEFPDLATKAYLRGGARQQYVRLSVRDNGPGMDAETMERIFEPFFTTKPSGEGTGMGLAVVHGIVRSLGGAVSVESTAGKGTVFHVVLPAAEEVEDVKGVAAEAPPRGSGRILFVDDEVVILRLASRMLQSLGYESVCCSEGRKALDIFSQDPRSFDLVITDQVMPEMTGAELTRSLLEIRPDLPIVLCTGFSEKFSRPEAKAAGIREFVMKPIERRDLAVAIERALGAQPAAAEEPPEAGATAAPAPAEPDDQAPGVAGA